MLSEAERRAAGQSAQWSAGGDEVREGTTAAMAMGQCLKDYAGYKTGDERIRKLKY